MQRKVGVLLRRVVIIAALVALVPLSTPGVSAFEVFGIKLFEDQSEIDAEAVIGDPQPYAATLSTSATGDLEQAILAASTLISEQSLPASGAAGLLARARGDYKRILGALYDRGFYGGAISILVDGREASQLPPDATLNKPASVQLRVDPGPVFRFAAIGIVNRAPATNDPADQVDLPEQVGFGRGGIARSSIIVRAEQVAVEAWRQQGYAEASVVDRNVIADHATNSVDVTITVEPGRLAHVGNVTVSGTERMDPEFVATQTGLEAGAEYDPDDIERAESRLARLDVFRAMRIEAASGGIGSNGLLPFNVLVEEQAQRRFGVGATYSTVDGFGVEGFHLWRNLFGRAERLRLDAKLAGINVPVNSAEFDYAFGATFTKPGFLNPDNDLVAAISAERTVLPAYTETSALAKVGLTQYLNDQLTLDGAAIYKRSQFEDDFGTRNFSLAGLTGGLIWDTRDDSADPTEGFFVNVTAEPFYEFYYGNPIFRTTAEVRGYLSIMADDQLVLAARAKVGALVGPSLDEIPPDLLFFAGGGGSVRGYAYKGIGVDQPDDTVTGGRYLVEGSLEARYKVMNDIGVVGFVDAGYVAADEFPSLEELRIGVGMGLRYYTSFGPLRLDLAVPLNKRATDPDYAIYVGIGQAF
jgi:translocation and assembly module TamA